MAMLKIHKKALDKTLSVFTDDLDVLGTLVHLQSNGIFEQQDVDFIRVEKPGTQVMELIKRIKQKGQNAYQVFREFLLQREGSKHIAEVLDKHFSEVTLKRDDNDEIRKWKGLEEKFHTFVGQRESIHSYDNIPDEINILLLGKIKSGKSATGNTIMGKPGCFAESDSFELGTKSTQVKTINEGKFRIRVIDTPGFLDAKQELQNENLLLDLTKEMVKLGGIHLFLWVCHSMSEEQEIIDLVETAFTEDVYSKFIVVLTNAYSKFSSKRRKALTERVKEEHEKGGTFAHLLLRVKDKIIAVENEFAEDNMAEIHRQKLLCCLAQVIHDNKGSVYSKDMFVDVKARMEHRIKWKEESKKVAVGIDSYLPKYLTRLSLTQLENVLSFSDEEISNIIANSDVGELSFISSDDVRKQIHSAIKTHEKVIADLMEKLRRDDDDKLRNWKRLEEKFYGFRTERESIHSYDNIPDKINIVLLGKVKSGKSATGNTILGKADYFAESDSSQSSTEGTQVKTINEGKFRIRVVDTPGLLDPKHAFQNEILLTDVAEEMVNLGGIHLFLWVCNSMMEEEEEIFDLIETTFTDKVYNHFIVVLTNAYSKFAGEKRTPLTERVKQEHREKGACAIFFLKVKDKVIAVENEFEEGYMSDRHRQKLLCCLAQVLYENKGAMYSKEMLANVKTRIQHRLKWKVEFRKMEQGIDSYLFKHLTRLSLQQLEEVLPLSEEEFSKIKAHSGIQERSLISSEDVAKQIHFAVEKNVKMVSKLKKSLETRGREERERRRREREELERELEREEEEEERERLERIRRIGRRIRRIGDRERLRFLRLIEEREREEEERMHPESQRSENSRKDKPSTSK